MSYPQLCHSSYPYNSGSLLILMPTTSLIYVFHFICTIIVVIFFSPISLKWPFLLSSSGNAPCPNHSSTWFPQQTLKTHIWLTTCIFPLLVCTRHVRPLGRVLWLLLMPFTSRVPAGVILEASHQKGWLSSGPHWTVEPGDTALH